MKYDIVVITTVIIYANIIMEWLKCTVNEQKVDWMNEQINGCIDEWING